MSQSSEGSLGVASLPGFNMPVGVLFPRGMALARQRLSVTAGVTFIFSLEPLGMLRGTKQARLPACLLDFKV